MTLISERLRVHRLIPAVTIRVVTWEGARRSQSDHAEVYDHRTAHDAEEMVVNERGAIDASFALTGSQENDEIRPPHTILVSEANIAARFTDRIGSGPYPTRPA